MRAAGRRRYDEEPTWIGDVGDRGEGDDPGAVYARTYASIAPASTRPR